MSMVQTKIQNQKNFQKTLISCSRRPTRATLALIVVIIWLFAGSAKRKANTMATNPHRSKKVLLRLLLRRLIDNQPQKQKQVMERMRLTRKC
jgi:hypothetical protein